MIFGMSVALFTTIHVIISLAAILAGFVVVFGMLQNRHSGLSAAIYLVLIALTSLTGYPIPPLGFGPPQVVGTISLVVIVMAVAALYVFHLNGVWRGIYVGAAVAALYFDCFVGVAQAFGKIPALHALAPTQSSPGFLAAQIAVLVIFVILGYFGVKRFHPGAA